MTIAPPERQGSSVPRRASRPVPGWRGTRRALRAARVGLPILCVVAGGIGVLSAQARVDVADEIADRTEPLSADAVEVYRSLADADAIVAQEFLVRSEEEKQAAQLRYDGAIERAAASLAHAGTQASEEGLSTERIAAVTQQLPVYTELVGRARADGDLERLREASGLMQSTILRQTEALQRDESGRLDEQYRRTAAFPSIALGLAAVCLAALAFGQLFLFRRTKRVLNVGLLVATGLVLSTLLWWTVALSTSRPDLRSSQRRSQSITAALGPAQIAARQARTSELLALLASDPASDDNNFRAKMQIVARSDGDMQGVGGALGAARNLASDSAALERVDAALVETGAWLRAHERVQELAMDEPNAARELALSTEAGGAAVAFEKLNEILSESVDEQRRTFTRDIGDARSALASVVPVTVLAAVVSAVAAAWGIGRRLEEYR